MHERLNTLMLLHSEALYYSGTVECQGSMHGVGTAVEARIDHKHEGRPYITSGSNSMPLLQSCAEGQPHQEHGMHTAAPGK